MNCVVGDLAIAKKGSTTPEMANRFVVVVRRAIDGERLDGIRFRTIKNLPAWVIRSAVDGVKLPSRDLETGKLRLVSERAYQDGLLIPIRDLPGEDESLLWCPVPGERVTA